MEGADRAAQAYFGRDVGTLTPAEAAFLAALPQQPSRYNPWRDPAPARRRQARILNEMRARGWLPDIDHEIARGETLTFSRATEIRRGAALRRTGACATAAKRPRRVETTLDAALQRSVQGIIEAHRPALERHRAWNVAVAVLDNRTGEWLAWEGSGNYFDTEHQGPSTASRRRGSPVRR